MKARDKKRNLLTLLGATGCVLAACSVDTSDIKWVPDKDFDPGNLGGIANAGGVLNEAGDKGKAGSDAGEDGGEGNCSGSSNAGTDAGGKPTSGGAGGVSNIGGGGAGMGGGTGGMPPMTGYPCKARVKAPALIADFSDVKTPDQTWSTAGKELTFGTYAYPPNGGAPTRMPKDGVLTAVAKVDRPNGFGIWITPCADADAAGFSSLGFKISGSRTDGQTLLLRVGIGINDNRIADSGILEGGCVPPMGQDAGYCRAAAKEIMLPPNAPAGMMDVVIPFDEFRMGNPASGVDPKQITSVEWGFIFLQQEPAYNATVSVDDVYFK
jgi:hypothetical protein